MTNTIKEGDDVLLNTPDNTRLHGTVATVQLLTVWGAHVIASAAATGQFRALFEEMILLEGQEQLAHTKAESHTRNGINGKHETNGVGNGANPPSVPAPLLSLTLSQSVDAGYTGNPCEKCGSVRTRYSGTCSVCEDCGSTSGCS